MTPMPKTRNYTQLEKRDAMDLLEIHDDISVVHMLTGIHQRTLRRWRKKLRRRQNVTLSEKDISLSAKRTKSDKVQTMPQPPVVPAKIPRDLPPPAGAANAEAEQARENFQSLLHIRDQLIRVSRQLADNLEPDDPDINLQTMALSRILERAHWLDETLYPSDELEDESDIAAQPNRIAFVYDETDHERPPWHNASEHE